MTTISKIIKEIWKDHTLLFNKEYQNALSMDLEELKRIIKIDINKNLSYIHSIDSELFSEVMLPSIGCSHRLNNGDLCGCSFCDYVSDYIVSMAQMNALKAKNKNEYALMMRYAFDQSRGQSPIASVAEVLTSYDTLDLEEFPQELFEMLFKDKDLYSKKPFQLEFETRASSVTLEKLEHWKQELPFRRVMVRLGVEVEDEWMRNHWLNKNISNSQIIAAVKNIHSVGWKANANLLLGIPGLTEGQAVEELVKSAIWAYDIGFDNIVISYLGRVGNSLQNYLYKYFAHNEVLNQAKVVNGEYTSLQSIFSFFIFFEKVYTKCPDIINKIGFSVFYTDVNKKLLGELYKSLGVECLIENAIIELMNFNQKRDPKRLLDIKKKLEESPLYTWYQENILSSEINNVHETMKLVVQELAKHFWPNMWEEVLNKFITEI